MNPQDKSEEIADEKILYFQDKLAKKAETDSSWAHPEGVAGSDIDSELYERKRVNRSFVNEHGRGEVDYSDVYDLLQNIFICLQHDIEVKKEIVTELKSIYVSSTEPAANKTMSSNRISQPDKPSKIVGILIFMNIIFVLISAYYFFDMASVIQPMGIFNQLQMLFGANFGGVAL